MTTPLAPKRPDEKRRLAHDWSAFLGEDTIVSQTTTSADVTVSGDAPSDDGKSIDFTVSDGEDGTIATITQAIVTAGGDHETETFILPIRNAEEPVSLTDAKRQLRILDDASEDILISALITAARDWVERYTGLTLLKRQFTERRLPEYGAISVRNRPLISVDEVKYGVSGTYVAKALTGDNEIVASPGTFWPPLVGDDAFEVTYTAGYEAGRVPEALLQAMLLLITHWFDNRSGEAEPVAVLSLLNPYRVLAR